MNFGCKWVDCCNCNWHLIIKCVPCQQYVCLLTFFIFILYFILYKCWLASFTSIDIIYPHSWWLNKCSPSYSVELPLSVSFSLLMTPCMSKKSKNIGHCLVLSQRWVFNPFYSRITANRSRPWPHTTQNPVMKNSISMKIMVTHQMKMNIQMICLCMMLSISNQPVALTDPLISLTSSLTMKKLKITMLAQYACEHVFLITVLSILHGINKLSCGKISFTADIWSNMNLTAYLALTVHWTALDQSTGCYTLKSTLIGFYSWTP